MIFDSCGRLILKDTSRCQWSGFDVIKTLKRGEEYPTRSGFRLKDLSDNIVQLEPEPPSDTSCCRPDFTVVVTWAGFLGSYNKPLFDLGEAARENHDAIIRMVWLNIDMQQSWHLRKDQKMILQ